MTTRAPQGQSRTSDRQAPPPRPISISGTYSDPAEVRRVLDEASANFNLVGALSFGELPEGFSVVVSTLKIDPAGETYDVGFGKYGLGSAAVRRIAGAAGVSTVSSTCRGWTLHYAAWEVTVGRLELDGTVRRETGNRVMDLREGSGQVVAMRERAVQQNKKDPDAQIREQRLHIGAHAETKAWLRAVRTLLGLRTYTKEELAKPFAMPKLQFSGRSHDPQLRVMFAQGLMNAALGGVAQLYGAQQQPLQLGAGAPPPPQLGMGGGFSLVDDDDAPPSGPRHQERGPAPSPRTPPSDRGAAAGAAAPAAQTSKPFVIPGGREKGKTLADASDECLGWWANTLRTNIDDGKSRSPDRDEELCSAMRRELNRRQGVVDEDPPDDAPPDDGYGDRANEPM